MIGTHKLPDGLHWWQPSVFIASGFGSGLLKPASGTIGSLVGFMLVFPFWGDGSFWHHLTLAALLSLFGLLTVQYLTYRLDDENPDPKWVVIDEWAGLALALAGSHTLPAMLVGMALFRFFDIVKPGPIKWLDDNVSGGLGVMADDWAAGIASLVILTCLQAFHVL